LAILGVEKIDLNGRGALCGSINGEREKNKDAEGGQKVFHYFMLPLIIYEHINFNSDFCREIEGMN
jgi:hypothetical protein